MFSTTMSLRILAIDDDPDTFRYLRSELSDLGCELVGYATDSETGLRLASKLRPDLILMDNFIETPMAGIDNTKRIMAECPTLVVIWSGADNPADELAAKEHGAFAYIMKTGLPDEFSDVIAAARNRLEQKQKRAQL